MDKTEILKRAVQKAREEIIKDLIIIRDVELETKPMMKSRIIYNINLLIESLTIASATTLKQEGKK